MSAIRVIPILACMVQLAPIFSAIFVNVLRDIMEQSVSTVCLFDGNIGNVSFYNPRGEVSLSLITMLTTWPVFTKELVQD